MPDLELAGYSDFTEIGRGGDSVVYRAWQDDVGRYVAVKVVSLADPAAITRFKRELAITVKLGDQHDQIVKVYNTGNTADGKPCLVMEYCDGSLHDRLKADGPLPVADVVKAGVDIADALAFAHQQRYVHRDVKPQNILVRRAGYVLADFGIARGLNTAHTASAELFSYRHAAPQVLSGKEPAAADDIWSLGSTLFTLLEGRPPFASDNPSEDTFMPYVDRVKAGEMRQWTRTDVPPEMVAVIERCLRGPGGDRYADAVALRNALTAVSTAPTGNQASATESAWRPEGAAAPVPRSPERVATGPRQAGDSGPPENINAIGLLNSGGNQMPNAVPPGADADSSGTGTGRRPADGEPADRSGSPTADEAKPAWRRVLVFAVPALVIGLALGLVGYLLRVDGQVPTDTAANPGGRVVPSATAVPSPSGTRQVEVSDPTLTPVFGQFTDNGSSIDLRWTDPSKGEATFIVVQVTATGGRALRQLQPGITSVTVEGLDPAASQYCFQIIAIRGDARAASQMRCTSRK